MGLCISALAIKNGSIAILPPIASWDGFTMVESLSPGQQLSYKMPGLKGSNIGYYRDYHFHLVKFVLKWKLLTLDYHVPVKSHSFRRQRVEQQVFQNVGWPGSGREQGDAIKIKDSIDAWLFKAVVSERTNYGNSYLSKWQPFKDYETSIKNTPYQNTAPQLP